MKNNKGIIINGGNVSIGTAVVGSNSIMELESRRAVNHSDELTQQHGNIFLSYRRSDSSDVTGRIYDRLVDVFDEKYIFKDVNSIPLGSNFKDVIENAIKKTVVFLMVISDNWIGKIDGSNENRIDNPNDFIRLEVLTSLENNIHIIPLFVGSSEMPDESVLPNDIKEIVYINGIKIRYDPDFNNDVDKLVIGIKKIMCSH